MIRTLVFIYKNILIYIFNLYFKNMTIKKL